MCFATMLIEAASQRVLARAGGGESNGTLLSELLELRPADVSPRISSYCLRRRPTSLSHVELKAWMIRCSQFHMGSWE